MKETTAWIEIILPNHSYWITCSKGKLYITASHMDTFPVRMTAERLVSMVEAFDSHLCENDVVIEQVFDRALMGYHAQKKSEEIVMFCIFRNIYYLWVSNLGRLKCIGSATQTT